jgi:CheY-like chemotaxis protein
VGGCILLVEDRDEDIEGALRSFKRARIFNEIVVKRDAAAALDFLKGLPDCSNESEGVVPAMILLDGGRPSANAIELLEKIRSIGGLHHVPIVVLTSAQAENDLDAWYERGASSCVRKQAAFGDIAALIRRVGLSLFLTQEIPPHGD